MYKTDLEKAEEPEIKLQTSAGSSRNQESFRKISTSALSMSKHLIVCTTTNWKILKEMGIPDHLTCLLRNLDAVQEATVITGHGTTDWFQIRKGVRQDCMLSPCLVELICRVHHKKYGMVFRSLLNPGISYLFFGMPSTLWCSEWIQHCRVAR